MQSDAGDNAGAPRRRRLFRGVALLLSIVVALGVCEVAVRAFAAAGRLEAFEPPSRSSYWDGTHPQFGVWHVPDSIANHRTECFEADYRASSIGARDVERSRTSDAPRVVVLGDSNTEGWGVAFEERTSSLLEGWTGVEHLNFAMAHFGPYQSYLVYRELARDYEHDVVLIGISPNTDFADLDYDAARRSPSYEYRYRPYLVGEYPDYRHEDYREWRAVRWLRRSSYLYNALDVARHRLTGDAAAVWEDDGTGLVPSHYYAFDERRFALLQYSLELLLNEAEGKTVVVFLVPLLRDMLRYDQSGESPLTRRLRAFGEERGLVVVDLMPPLHYATDQWYQLYFTCDQAHFNPSGHALAARALLLELQPVYRGLGRSR